LRGMMESSAHPQSVKTPHSFRHLTASATHLRLSSSRS
jgi:hypothetical protein